MAEVIGIRITAQDDTQAGLASVQRGLAQVSTAASSVGATLAGLGIGVSAAGFVAFTQNIINGVDALNDLKDATGATIENISALEDIARRSGTGLDTVSTALVKMNQALSSAKPGSDTEKAINALGLSVQNLKAQDPVVAFKSIADALGGYADDANKARLVQELFGKSLKDVAPLLKDTAEAAQLVATATTEQAEAAEKLNKQFFALQANASNAGRTMVSEFLPTLNAIAEQFLKADTAGGGLAKTFGGAMKTVFEAVSIAGANVAFVLQGMGREIGAIAAQLVAVGKLDFKGFHAISDAVKEDGERARKELDELQARIMGLNSKGGAGRGSVNPENVNSTPTVGDFAGPDKVAIAAANRELDAQKKLIAELAGLSGSFADDWNRLSAMFKNGKLSLADLTQAQAALLEKQPAMRTAAKELEEAQKHEAKATLDAAAARIKFTETLGSGLEKMRNDLAHQQEYNARLGLTKEAIAALDAAKLEEQATTLDGMAIKVLDRNLDEEQYKIYKAQAQALRDLAKAKTDGATKEAALDLEKENKKAAQQAVADWRRAAEKIQDSITDALMRGFESGKGFAENLRDTVVNMFKSMVLRPIVEIGVRGGLSMLGMGGLSGAANAASSMASLGEGASMLSGLSGWLTDFGGSVASTVSSMGRSIADLSEIGGSFGSTFDSVGTSLMDVSASVGKYAGIVGNGLGYLNAAIAANEGKWGKAIGAGVGTFFGGPIGGAIGSALGSLVDDGFNGGREYTTGTGIAGRFSGSSFDGRNYQDWRNDGSSFLGIRTSGSSSGTNYSAMDSALQKSLGAAYGSLLTQTAGFATALGANAASITGYQRDIRLSLGSDAEANKKAITAMFKGLADDVAAVVLDSRFMREGEGASDTLARLATNLTVVNGALDTLGDNLLGVSQYSGSIASNLVDSFGGIQAYQNAIGAYYQRFYTQEERLAKAREQITRQLADLGIGLPDTIAAYRALVNAQDLSTEAGRNTYTALIGMGSAFADITEAAQAAQRKLSDVAKSLETMLQSVVSARESVASARSQVSPAPVMTAAAIRAAVSAATETASTAAMNAAATDLGKKTVAASLADTTLKAAQTTAESKAAALATVTADNAALAAKYKAAATTAQGLATGYGMSINSSKATNVFANDAYSYNADTNRINDFYNFGYKTWTDTLKTYVAGVQVGSASTSYDTSVNKQSLQNALRGNSPGYVYQPGSGTHEAGSLIDILSGANAKLAEQSKKIAAAQTASIAAQTALTTATTNKAAADAAAKAASVAYTKAVDAWVVEASKSVPQLTKLRDETLRYYEAQKALAEGMATSAANLRQAIKNTRADQLDPLASAQQQQREFAQNYALALSTSGAAKAAYADKLSAALPALSEALKATSSRSEWTSTMARLFAQSNAIADQLDASAPKDYQVESLGLLDSIDGALAVLDDSTRAITRAIDASGGVTAAGLRAVVTTLGGVPSFDIGTNYVPRDMFARIHEGEAIVPKAFNPFIPGAQGAGMDTSRLEALVAQQAQQLEALRAELRAITIHTANTAENTRSMDKNGVLVFNDPQAPIETKVVA